MDVDGNDHISVGMRKPNGDFERPIPGKRLFWTKPGISVWFFYFCFNLCVCVCVCVCFVMLFCIFFVVVVFILIYLFNFFFIFLNFSIFVDFLFGWLFS